MRRVIEPLLSGGKVSPRADDIAYARDLGLVARHAPLAVANPIYREVIPRELTSDVQDTITEDPNWYVSKGGRLLVSKLLEAFQGYFRENSEHWVERFGYKEAGPQLLLQAFLQRLVNSGGRVEREYGLGADAHRPADCLAGKRRHGPTARRAKDRHRMQGASPQPEGDTGLRG